MLFIGILQLAYGEGPYDEPIDQLIELRKELGKIYGDYRTYESDKMKKACEDMVEVCKKIEKQLGKVLEISKSKGDENSSIPVQVETVQQKITTFRNNIKIKGGCKELAQDKFVFERLIGNDDIDSPSLRGVLTTLIKNLKLKNQIFKKEDE